MKTKDKKLSLKGAIATILTFLIILTNSSQTEALQVNTVTGSVVHTIKLHPLISLSYQSKAVSMGLFGESRCTELDYKLIYVSTKKIVVDTCFTILNLYPMQESKSEYFTRDLTFRISLKGALISLKTPDDKIFLFSKEGRLIKISDQNNFIILKKTQSKLSLSTFARQIHLRLNQQGLVTDINGKKQNYTFRYRLNKLRSVSKNRQLQFTYKYDRFSNLTELINQNFTRSFFYYEKSSDRVIRIQSSRCHSSIQYKSLASNTFQSTITSVCNNQEIKSTRTTITLNRFKNIQSLSIAQFDSQKSEYKPHKKYTFDGFQRLLSSKEKNKGITSNQNKEG